MKYIFTILFSILSFLSFSQDYKYMMDDRSYNVYEVAEEAEKYFSTIDRFAKGSGWMGYQRWLNRVEAIYYPSGDRMTDDPRKIERSYESLKKQYPSAELRSDEQGWVDLGPYTASNISDHYSPGIGRVEHVWVEPTTKQTMYLSSRSGGFWRSFDGGTSWENTTDDLTSSGVDVFSVNPTNINDILINVRNARNGVTMGIYRSLDSGATWTITAFNPDDIGIGGLGTNERVFDVKFSPHNSNHIYIAASGFLYRSTDNFATVESVSDNSYASIEFHQTDPDIIFAPREYYWNRNEIWSSSDGGDNWNLLHDIDDNNYRTFIVATTPADDDLVLFSSSTNIWKSIDNGTTIDIIPGSDGNGSDFEVSPTNPDIMINGGINIRMSYDGGETWDDVTDWYWPGGGTPPNDYVHADIRYASFAGGDIYCGTDGYMVKSPDNGVTWSILSNGTSIREYYKLGVSQSHNDVVVCGSQDNGTSIYKGQENEWLEWIGADGMECLVHPLDYNLMVGSIQNGNKRRSTTGGYNSQGINNHPNIGSLQWEAPLLYDPLDHLSLFTVGQTLHISSDFGSSWKALHDFGEGAFQHLAKSENGQGIILASKNANLFRSIDEGVTFDQVGTGTLPNSGIQDIAFDPTNDNNVVVVYAHHQDDIPRIFRSTDGGVTWADITFNLNAMPIRTVVIDHTDDKNIYLGAEIGIYKMPWNNNQYELWSDNMPTTTIEELEIVYGSNMLRAATWGRGLWERCLDGRDGFPKITKVEANVKPSETQPTNIENVTLSINIENIEEVSSAYVNYSFNGLDLDETISMSRFNKEQYKLDDYLPLGSANDKLYFKVYAINTSGDTTETYRYMYTLREDIGICSAAGASNTTSDYVNLVSMAGVTKNSGKDSYADFTSTIFELEQFGEYELEVGLYFHWEPDTVYAFIDWNSSNTFEEDEYYYFTMLDTNHIAFSQIDVPEHAVVGSTVRMRVRSQYWNSAPDPCGTATGEVEDYSILILDGCASNKEVNNLNDFGAGSLRHLIENTCNGDTIYIADFLLDDTLHIYNEEIAISSDLTIVGLSNYGFILSGNGERRVFKIEPNTTLSLLDLKFIDGQETLNGGAIHNLGDLILTNVEFQNNKEENEDKALSNNGTVTVKSGTTNVKE
ncbi:MAG: photosystem II stability/assembly factor-like uncharacterized protein [Saprospiraceae bacterium]|jgi:photosystem II stability/assembly factor-like uncharacterized protein